ncbi:MAG: Gfo/Idh/MocA family oxidoreductase [Theionarchaea archaeon]|nr:Gfo/Idh/MocA family oxidoreductase [Theionarchaea archaeon]
MRIGILGAGTIGITHIVALRKMSGIEIVLAEKDPVKRAFVSQRFSIKETHDSIEGLARAQVEGAIIALPVYLHLPAVQTLAESGAAVLCEKPLARTSQEAHNVKEAISDSTMLMGFMKHFHPAVQFAVRYLQDHPLGPLAGGISYKTQYAPRASWYLKKETAGGGCLLDIGCHMINLLLELSDDLPECVFMNGGTRIPEKRVEDEFFKTFRTESCDVEDWADLIMKFQDHTVNLHLNWVQEDTPSFAEWTKLFFERGTLELNLISQLPLRIYSKNEKRVIMPSDITTPWETLFEIEDRHFIKCIKGESTPSVTIDDGILVQEIIESAYKSMHSGRFEQCFRGVESTKSSS